MLPIMEERGDKEGLAEPCSAGSFLSETVSITPSKIFRHIPIKRDFDCERSHRLSDCHRSDNR